LIMAMPPRHGKSEYCSRYLPAWFAGKFPDKRVMLGSYEADFAAQWGRRARNTLEEFGLHLFGVSVAGDSSAANRWGIAGREGGMQTAGVGGPFTGKGADLLIVDDPIKGFEEAASETWRDKTWEWWLQNAYTRLEPGGTAIIIATRWHEDDLTGRILEEMKNGGEKWKLVRLPAIAEEEDAIGRRKGEALWDARYPLADLERIKLTLGPHRFEALYQQNPSPPEGGMFKREWFEIVDADACPVMFDSLVRAWDFAGTEGDGDWTAGVLIGQKGLDVFAIDVVRGQWGSGTRDERVFATACQDEELYGEKVQIWFPQDPGQAGKGQAEGLVMKLRGYRVKYEPVSGDKETRADPMASTAWAGWKQGRRIKVVRAAWNRAFLDELCTFPNGKHDDQVDAAALAFVKLVKGKKRVLVA